MLENLTVGARARLQTTITHRKQTLHPAEKTKRASSLATKGVCVCAVNMMTATEQAATQN